mmetsp:Transcript_13024/g.17658  ORF Transcript_13024/g.17658 Transcript_13024/m.17658 type:complete len:269 (+) Transcript_13024:275-1081(+)
MMWGTFQNIQASEFLDGAWERREQSPHLAAMSDTFNRLSSIIVESILFSPDQFRHRVLQYSIKLANLFWTMKNFQGLAAVVSGLNQSSITRLKPLWADLKTKYRKKFQFFDQLLSPNKNFKNYRKILQLTEPPILPWLSPKLRELRFLYDGNSTTNEFGFVNLTHLMNIGESIQSILDYQKQEFVFLSPCCCDKSLLLHFLNSLSIPEETCYQQSLLIVPQGQLPKTRRSDSQKLLTPPFLSTKRSPPSYPLKGTPPLARPVKQTLEK